jgi:hypothetical protein
MMAEVFKTNVRKLTQAKQLVGRLQEHFPQGKINFDLKDCDKILRIDGYSNISSDVIDVLNREGFICEELE